MKREQIIEILKEYMDMEWEECADAILALPIDVPTEEEIKNYFTKEHFHYEKGRYTKCDKDRIFGAKWAINEIIKRNK
jgi:hypothetical protein